MPVEPVPACLKPGTGIQCLETTLDSGSRAAMRPLPGMTVLFYELRRFRNTRETCPWSHSYSFGSRQRIEAYILSLSRDLDYQLVHPRPFEVGLARRAQFDIITTESFCARTRIQQDVENHDGGHDSVMPAKPAPACIKPGAGIQAGIDSLDARFLDTGFRRCDEPFFNKLLNPRCLDFHICWRASRQPSSPDPRLPLRNTSA